MRQMRVFLIVTAVFLISGCVPRIQYAIISEDNGKCLSLNPTGGFNDGERVEQWACDHYIMAGLQYEWQFDPADKPNTYHIVSMNSGKCLEVNQSAGGKNNGDIIQQSKCAWVDNQLWTVDRSTPTTAIISRHSGKCAEVKLGATKDGDPIDQWDCTPRAKNQMWRLQSIKDGPNPPLDTVNGELCNACNPSNPKCKTGAMCIELMTKQWVCGRICSATVGCPKGYRCALISGGAQCVPDNSCVPY